MSDALTRYADRSGYDADFLGVHLPIPNILDPALPAYTNANEYVLDYEHFSLIMHAARRLAMLTASNIDGRPQAKEPEPDKNYSRKGLGGDHWKNDPRIPDEAQLPDRFYTKDRGNFDKGHIVRRDDVAWGKSYEEVKLANKDSFHVTNCSPQVDSFNRSNKQGEWGRLENYILEQAAVERYSVFSGPVLDDDNDKNFRGEDKAGDVMVQIPSRFWKIIMAADNGNLETFAFLLEQDLSSAEVEFDVSAEWAAKMISIDNLQDLIPDIEIPEVLFETDQIDRILEGLGMQDESVEEFKPSEAEVIKEAEEVDLTWDDGSSATVLERLAKSGDRSAAGKLLDDLCTSLDRDGRRIETSIAKKVLSTLRQFAWFDELRRVGLKFEEHAQDDPQVLIYLAQGRIELGEMTDAIRMLLMLKDELEERQVTAPDDATIKTINWELGEVTGLLGRAYKQLYVNAGPSGIEPRSYDLEKSLEYYRWGYENQLGDYLWHGVNVIALMTHMRRVEKNRHNAVSPTAVPIANAIGETLEVRRQSGPLGPWDLAKIVEVHLAQGQNDLAIEATQRYLAHPGSHVFEVQSTFRQLRELWSLTVDVPPGDTILPLFESRMAVLGGKPQATILHGDEGKRLERVWGKTRYHSVKWLQQALECSTAVARINFDGNEGIGTGFLFDGSWIGPDWAGQPLLMTNAHVCSDDPALLQLPNGPLPMQDLTAEFAGATGQDPQHIAFAQLIWTSPPSELDATLLLMEHMPAGCKLPVLCTRRPMVTMRGEGRLNILGHPKGLDLRLSLQDNKITGIEEKYVYYKTPTDPGSSGSPVFDQKWRLVALHHAAAFARKANEGVRMEGILQAIKTDLGQ